MKFEIEVGLTEQEAREKYPIGSVHEVEGKTAKVIGYRKPLPTIMLASYPCVIFEEEKIHD